MGKKKDHQMKNTKIAVFLLSVGLICSASTTCMAGGMNANEASVYAAASGTFEYEGKTLNARRVRNRKRAAKGQKANLMQNTLTLE